MSMIIDASKHVDTYAKALLAAGVHTVFRYYTRDSPRDAQKRLHPEEARKLADAGLRIGAVYEGRIGDEITYFDAEAGLADATFARTYANHVIGQPAGSAIYFGVDSDASKDALSERVVPYFQAVAKALREENGEPHYRIGAYGSGLTCKTLLEAGLVDLTWVAQSTGWRGSAAFVASGRATMVQRMPAAVAGLGCDPIDAAAGADIGDFSLNAPRRPTQLIASGGARPPATPGTPAIPAQAAPASVRPLPSAAPAPPPAPGSYHDALLVPRLIELGSSSAGLTSARTRATELRPGYPKDGSAAHLFALLEHAGVDAAFSPSVGKLAFRLEQRGWTRIAVGHQRPGDIGVVLNGEPPDEGEHIYLVVDVLPNHEMTVADNRNGTADAPHDRFSIAGHGSSPTDYFLRA